MVLLENIIPPEREHRLKPSTVVYYGDVEWTRRGHGKYTRTARGDIRLYREVGIFFMFFVVRTESSLWFSLSFRR